MDFKQKLKNRLNLKFEPLPSHTNSLRRINPSLKRQQKKQKVQPTITKNRSISQLRLPSLDRKQKLITEKSQVSINIQELRSKVKSIKNIPPIKVQSKAPIHETITYLLKNQILTVPKIVGLLQKSRSDQFLYMKVLGTYQYQVCDDHQKGNNYVTVSSNGMVLDGQLIPLESLIHQFDMFTKLQKIHYFKYFSTIKLFSKWNKGSKKAHFTEKKRRMIKLLNLDNPKLLSWKKQLYNDLSLNLDGGWISDKWAQKVSQMVFEIRKKVKSNMSGIIYEMLQPFQLPITNSTDLMNSVLGNMVTLNRTFEEKIRIERQLDIFYKLGRNLQFYFFSRIGNFLLQHLNSLSNRIFESVQSYKINILDPLEQLDINKDNYAVERQKIIGNSAVSFDINYNVIINNSNELEIIPNSNQLNQRFINEIREFVSYIEEFDLSLIRNKQYAFVTKNVLKGAQDSERIVVNKFRQYILSLPDYIPYVKDLALQLNQFQIVMNRRMQILSPFLKIYQEFSSKPVEKINCNIEEISTRIDKLDQKIQFCQKIHDGQFFVFGFLNQGEAKEKILHSIQDYKHRYIQAVPQLLRKSKSQLQIEIQKHLKIMNMPIIGPDKFMTVYNAAEGLDELIPEYSGSLIQLERIQELYQRITKKQLPSFLQLKNLLQSLRQRNRNFKETRQNNYALYRRQLEQKAKNMSDKVKSLIVRDDGYYNLNSNPKVIHSQILKSLRLLQNVRSQLNQINDLQHFYGLKRTIIAKLQILIVQYQSLEDIWKSYEYWDDAEKIFPHETAYYFKYREPIKEFQQSLRKLQKYSKNVQYSQICKFLIQKCFLYLNCLEIIEDLQSDHVREKDFAEIQALIMKQLGVENVKCRILTIRQIFQHNIVSLKDQIGEIVFKARKEIQIEQMIDQYKQWWKQLKLQYHQLQQYPLIVIFEENDHIRQEIQEQTTLIVNILNHKYGAFARRQCNNLLKQLNSLIKMLQLAIIHQEKFLSLFPILTSRYAEKQFTTQYKKFDIILTKSMRNIKVLIKPTQCLNEHIKSLLNGNIKQFDAISKVLSTYLQKKRLKFQRFYFLQDDDLLEVLVGIAGQSNIFRMFDGIKGWLVNQEGTKYGVQGVGGQPLVLKNWSYRNQQPELIFKYLQESIKSTLNSTVRKTLYKYEIELKQLSTLYQQIPWMCIYTVELILFTKQIELNCFQENISLDAQLSLIQETIANVSLSPKRNSNYITLLLFLQHFTMQLKHKEVYNPFRFQWNSFLRYYYENQQVVMRALGGQHNWGGEYQGYWDLMINTSDIRRAHACVLGNLKYGNGVLLQGPSGTGKTQSLKQLARCMAKYCVLFNCSNQINIRTLQKLLSGLCYTASWLCLDQINRLTTEVMSVVANHIATIKNAILNKKEIFNFLGKDIKLKVGVGIFATMNPIYLRRAKLTENLKQYFRVISVNVPDYQKILQVLLYGLNFSHASKLSKRISKMFKNLSIQLDDHPQYDFGLRAMKFLIFNIQSIRKTKANEQDAVIEGLIKSFYGRLDTNDVSTFEKVITDTFGKDVQFPGQGILKKLESMKGIPQTGMIVLGPTSSKTTLVNLYIDSLGYNLNVQRYNPTSISLKYFMGQSVLGRWQQGVIQKIARDSLNQPDRNHLLVLDSRIKSEIIQNFNSLLDQSKILSLPNGTRLKIHNNFKLVMQTNDLTLTSPATITRCNVTYVSTNDISKQDVIKQKLPKVRMLKQYKKIWEILNCLSIGEILQLSNVYPILMFKGWQDENNWQQGHIFGFEKVIIFSLQLLGLGDNIKKYLTKQNSISSKKNLYQYILSFQKYIEGEYIDVFSDYQPLENLSFKELYVPTNQTKFCDSITRKTIQSSKSLLWVGGQSVGKTTAITHSLKEHSYHRVPMSFNLDSRSLINYLEEKIVIKNKQSILQVEKANIFIDNIGLAQQQSSEMLRFMMEFGYTFLHKNSSITKVAEMSIIGQLNQSCYLEPRLVRHFAKLNYPKYDEHSIKALFASIFKKIISDTLTQAAFKSSVQIQTDKLSIFLFDYIHRKDKNNSNIFKLEKIFHSLPLINSRSFKTSNDLIRFFFNQLRWNEIQLGQMSNLDNLKLSYNEIFRGKYHQQYKLTIKQTAYYAMSKAGGIQIVTNMNQILEKFKSTVTEHFYFSQFVTAQILSVLRSLEWASSNYVLSGPPAIGKKTILKMATIIQKIQKHSFPTTLQNQKELSSWIFNIFKKAIARKSKQAIMFGIEQSNERNIILNFFEKLYSRFHGKYLFTPEETDYIYTNINEQISNYDKQTKSYDQIIDDYIAYGLKHIHLLISSQKKQLKVLEKYHYLNKNIAKRLIESYPEQSLISVSEQILDKHMQDKSNINKLVACTMKMYNQIKSMVDENEKMGSYHLKINEIKLFSFFENYCQLTKRIKIRHKQTQDILNRSIAKVHETSEILQQIKKQLLEMEPQIKIKKQSIIQTVPILEEKKRITQEVKYSVMLQQRQIDVKRKELQSLVKEVENTISKAQPLLSQANESIGLIKRSELSQIKNNNYPHPLIQFGVQCMAILLGQADNWENIKKMLSDTALITKIKACYPTQKSIQKVKGKIEQNHDWTIQNATRISNTLRLIFKWVKGLIKYSDLRFEVQRQQQIVDDLRLQLSKSLQKAQIKEKQLKQKQQILKNIEQQYTDNLNETNRIQQQLQINQIRYQNAQKIGSGLSDELLTWKKKLQKLNESKNLSEAHIFLITCFLHIYPMFHLQEKEKIEKFIRQTLFKIGLRFDPNFDSFQEVKEYLITDEQKELFSYDDINNPSLVTLLYNWDKRPILLDPDNQATFWLEKTYGDKCVTTRQHFASAVKTVQNAMKQGQILILLIDNYLDKFTNDVINSRIIATANRTLIEYNKNMFYLHQNFRVMICSKHRNPNIPSKRYIQHQIINFEVTQKLLVQSLLAEVLKCENEEMYSTKLKLQFDRRTNEKSIKQIEDQIIRSLISNKKVLIDDRQFISLLDQSVQKTNFEKQNSQKISQTFSSLQKHLGDYQQLCSQIGRIYGSLKRMSKISMILNWTIQIFIEYFIRAVKQSISYQAPDMSLPIVLPNGNEHFQYQHYSIALSNSRPTSALSMISAITSQFIQQERRDDFQQQQIMQNSIQNSIPVNFDQLVGAGQYLIDQNKKGFIPKQRQQKIVTILLGYLKHAFNQQQRMIWGMVLALSDQNPKQMKLLFQEKKKNNLKRHIEKGQVTENLKKYFEKIQNPESFALKILEDPNPFTKYLDKFTKIDILLLCKYVKPRIFNDLVLKLIQFKNYSTVLQYQQVSISNWFQKSDNLHPIMLIMGEDPLQRLTQHLGKKKYKNVILLAMGQGQSKVAEIILEKQSRKQNLVILHNLHISQNFFTFLAKTLQQFHIRHPHKNFRLILITNMIESLPSSITATCHKYIIQQPSGIRDRVKYLKEQFPIILADPLHRKLAYSLALFHALINQLNKYKPFGFVLNYNFTSSDYAYASKVLKQILEASLQISRFKGNIDSQELENSINHQFIDYECLRYLIGDVSYVGKMADESDRVKMKVYVNKFINKEILNLGHRFMQLQQFHMPATANNDAIEDAIKKLPKQNSQIYGFHQGLKPISTSIEFLIKHLSETYFVLKDDLIEDKLQPKPIQPIHHKFDYINRQIIKFNLNPVTPNGIYLRQIKSSSKSFSLRTFSNPRQFFIDVKKEVANKNKVQYDKVQLIWSVIPRQTAFALTGLKLEGASIKNGCLDDGFQELDLTIYVHGMVRKRQKEHQKLVSIPMYLNRERQGKINSYGDNTNLITKIRLEANRPEQFWILRGTAFIVI